MVLIWLGVIISKNFTEESWRCCVVIFREPFTGKLCLFALFSVKIDLELQWIFFVLLNFLVTNLLTHMLFTCEEKCFIRFVGYSTTRICERFSIHKWAVNSVEDQCKMQKTKLIERKTGGRTTADRMNRTTGMWLSWYAIKKATQGLAKVQRCKGNDKPGSDISQL